MAAIFVTGTGTDVGKTFITAALTRHLRGIGRQVAAVKPVVTGYEAASMRTSDPGVLLGALGLPVNADEIEAISPWRFVAPLSPNLAAQREGRLIDFRELVEFSRRAGAQASDLLLIEGVGGIMVPLDGAHTVLDWMTALRHPLLLVAGSYLGTISHTLTALHVLAQRNLDIAAVVVSESAQSPCPLAETVATIADFADSIEIIGVPRIAGSADAHPAIARIARLL